MRTWLCSMSWETDVGIEDVPQRFVLVGERPFRAALTSSVCSITAAARLYHIKPDCFELFSLKRKGHGFGCF